MSSAEKDLPQMCGHGSMRRAHRRSFAIAAHDWIAAFFLKKPQFPLRVLKFDFFTALLRYFAPGVDCMRRCDTSN